MQTVLVSSASPAWPDVPAWSQQVVAARTANEARLFVQCQGGAEVESRAVETQLHILARHPEGDRVYRFTLACGAPLDPTDFGEGASAILDPAELLFFADRVVRELPAPEDPVHPRAVIRRLRLGAAALREAAAIVEQSAAERGQVGYFTAAARDYAAAHPDRMTPAALRTYAAALDGHAAEWERR